MRPRRDRRPSRGWSARARRLTALYLLTVADIRGTSPKVWNAWKGKLLEDLYRLTLRALGGARPNLDAEIEARKQEARQLLALHSALPGTEEPLWKTLDVELLRAPRRRPTSPGMRARCGATCDTHEPVVRARPSSVGEGLQVLVYSPDRPDLFARICGYFDSAGFSIQDAKIHTTRAGYALDTFQVISPQLRAGDPAAYRDLISLVETQPRWRCRPTGPLPEPEPRPRVAPRALVPGHAARHAAPRRARAALAARRRASDRSGLLYAIARVLARHHINLQLAKITTLGERVEDTFLVDGPALQQNRTQLQIESELLDAVAPQRPEAVMLGAVERGRGALPHAGRASTPSSTRARRPSSPRTTCPAPSTGRCSTTSERAHRRHAVQAGLAASRRARRRGDGGAQHRRATSSAGSPTSRATGGRWSTAGAAASARARWPGSSTRSAFARALLEGGYKAFRARGARRAARRCRSACDYRVVCGRTGSGKTRLLQALAAPGAQVLDLEGAGQPPRLGARRRCPAAAADAEALRHAASGRRCARFDPARPVFVESESRKIGELRVPEARQLAMSTVIAWFGNLSFDQQKDALDRMQGEHEQSRSAKRAELVTQLAALGYAVPKKRGRPRRQGKWRRQRSR